MTEEAVSRGPLPKDDDNSDNDSARSQVKNGEQRATSTNLKKREGPDLHVAVSFDSEPGYGPFGLNPLTVSSTPAAMQPRGESIFRCEASDRTSYDVDDDNFEILLDDDDAGEDAKKERPALIRRGSAPTPKTEKLRSPPKSPTQSPEGSPSGSPEVLPRKILSRMVAPLSPRQRIDDVAMDSSLRENRMACAHRRMQTNLDDFAAKSPLSRPLRAMRIRALAAYKGYDHNPAAIDPIISADDWVQDEDVSSSEESFSEDEDISSDEESEIFEDGFDESELVGDFSTMPPMPSSFLDIPPDLYDFLDAALVQNIRHQKISIFAYEHHLLVKALLQLLAERDIVGVEGDIDDKSNVIKMGPLKKKSSRGIWSVKYVEIRQGNLSYFADHAKKLESADRKTIHLRKRTCKCVAAAEANNTPDGFVFVLQVEGGPKKFWMAKSEEERNGWIRAVNQSMVGETEGSQDNPVDLSIYQTAIEAYQSVQGALKQVESRADYLVAVDSLLYRKSSSSALRVPMTWIREEVLKQQEDQSLKDNRFNVSVKSTIADNWKSLSATSVDINGYLIQAGTPYSAERIVGTLSRCILEYDRVDDVELEDGISTKQVKRADKDSAMSEVEAVSYARSILLGALRSERHGEAAAAVQHLVQNEEVAKVELEKSEPLRIDVSFAGNDLLEKEQNPYDISGWLMTRLKRSKTWKSRFFVVSEGVLSFFAEAEPRPFGLRGQIVLNKCSVETLDNAVLLIKKDEGQRFLQFADRGELLKWRNVLERAAEIEGLAQVQTESVEHISKRGKRAAIVSNLTVKPLQTATGKGVKVGMRAMKAMKDAKEASMKKARVVVASIRQRGQATSEQRRRQSTKEMLMASTRGFSNAQDHKREPTVHVITEMNRVFRVMSVDCTENSDPLLIIRVKLYQAFVMSGGANGRLYRGDELIEMEFLGLGDGDHEFLEAPTSL